MALRKTQKKEEENVERKLVDGLVLKVERISMKANGK
jgi:hypothetical protein